MGLDAGQGWGGQREGDLCEPKRARKKGWAGNFWPEERSGETQRPAWVGAEAPARTGPWSRVAERLGEGRTPVLEGPLLDPAPEAPAGKTRPVGPPPSQSSGAKTPSTFTTSGG